MQTIIEAWSMKSRDLYPVEISPDQGWEPIKASQFLADYELGTLDYKPIGNGEWSSSSPYFKLGTDAGSPIWQNNLAYYVSGSQFTATELTVILNINVPDDARSAEHHFTVVGVALIEAAVSADAVEFLKGDLAGHYAFNRTLDHTNISLVKDSWEGGAVKGGYDWTLKLLRGDARQF